MKKITLALAITLIALIVEAQEMKTSQRIIDVVKFVANHHSINQNITHDIEFKEGVFSFELDLKNNLVTMFTYSGTDVIKESFKITDHQYIENYLTFYDPKTNTSYKDTKTKQYVVFTMSKDNFKNIFYFTMISDKITRVKRRDLKTKLYTMEYFYKKIAPD